MCLLCDGDVLGVVKTLNPQRTLGFDVPNRWGLYLGLSRQLIAHQLENTMSNHIGSWRGVQSSESDSQRTLAYQAVQDGVNRLCFASTVVLSMQRFLSPVLHSSIPHRR